VWGRGGRKLGGEKKIWGRDGTVVKIAGGGRIGGSGVGGGREGGKMTESRCGGESKKKDLGKKFGEGKGLRGGREIRRKEEGKGEGVRRERNGVSG